MGVLMYSYTNVHNALQGRIQVFFLGGTALVSCSTSTTINHIVFFLAEYQLY